jgi:hypothetical protein
MRIGRTTGALLLAGLIAQAGFAQDVSYDFEASFDFSEAGTYAWVEGMVVKDNINHRRIVDAVNAQLAAKGLTEVGAREHPDLLVAYRGRIDEDQRISGVGSGWGGYRWGRSGTLVVDEVLVGTLVVEIMNAGDGATVWRGIASRKVDANASPEKREKRIDEGVKKLFRNYPPPRKTASACAEVHRVAAAASEPEPDGGGLQGVDVPCDDAVVTQERNGTSGSMGIRASSQASS